MYKRKGMQKSKKKVKKGLAMVMATTIIFNGSPVEYTQAVTETTVNSLSATSTSTEILYSGSYKDTTWTIDNNGLLEVKGTGNMYPVGDMPQWMDYAEQIKSAKIEVTGATTLELLFNNCINLKSVDLSMLDTSEVTSMSCMFCDCSNLKTLDVSNFNTSKVEDMTCMFHRCSSLTSLDVSNFDTSNVTSMWSMFFECSKIKKLDLSNFDTSKVTAMYSMFCDCSSLANLNISSFDTSNVTIMTAMFYGCSSLTVLDLRNFDISNIEDDMGGSEAMLSECKKLTTIYTPKKSGKLVPELPSSAWKDSTGQVYKTLPANSQKSIMLTLTSDANDSASDINVSATTTIPKKNTILSDTKNKCKVKVSSNSTKSPTVTYTESTNSKATSITIPATVTVNNVTYKVTSVAASAFSGNKKLTKVTIGKNVTSVGQNAFKGCTKLKSIVVKSSAIKTVGKNAIKGTNKKLVIKVPSKKLSNYKKLFKGKGNTKAVVKK